MDSNYVDKSRLPSRQVTEGPERAPHRSFLYAASLPSPGRDRNAPVNVSENEFTRRKAAWKPRETEFGSGAIWKYAQLVGPARYGALTNPGARGEKEQYADI